jgi:hypothetical protein
MSTIEVMSGEGLEKRKKEGKKERKKSKFQSTISI